MQENEYSIINRYGDNFTSKTYITNPAIGREEELKKLILVLLTPDKSAILTGKPGIGKTAIVEGLAYKIQKDEVPDALKGYEIVKIDTQALVGTVKDTGDTRVQALIDEIIAVENIVVTEEVLDEQLNMVGQANQMTKEQVLEKIDLEGFKRDLSRMQASRIIVNNAVEK